MSIDPGSPGRTAGRDTPTLDQVARAAGVSRATVSRVVNGEAHVSAATRSVVERAVSSLGYRPNRAARALATGRTDSVALIVPEPDELVLSDPFFAGTLRGLSAALADTDVQLVLMLVRPGEAARRAVDYVRGGHVDGAVVASHRRRDVVDDPLLASQLPLVFIGRPAAGVAGVPYVDVDNVEGGRLAAAHLLERGHRRIGTLAGPADMSAGVDRLRGWRQALAAAGMADDAVEQGDFTPAGGAAAVERLLAAHPDVDAVFVASDLMASGALGYLAARGIAVPGQVAVVGYDDLGVAESTAPALTTVASPVVAMARAAGRLLLGRMSGDVVPGEPVILTPSLVERDST